MKAGDCDPASVDARSIVPAGDRQLIPAEDRQLIPAEDRLIGKARRILDLIQKRNLHFGHPLMADHAMDVMLSLFLMEFADPPCPDLASDRGGALGDHQVLKQLLEAGLIERATSGDDEGTFGLTPMGAGRMRSFVSAYPDAL